MNRQIFAAAAGIALLLCLAGCSEPASTEVVYGASYPDYASMQDLAANASVVVRATLQASVVEEGDNSAAPQPTDAPTGVLTVAPISDASPEAAPSDTSTISMVYTVFTFRINECFKGCDSKTGSISVAQLGGQLDGVTYVFRSAVDFAENQSYVLFLSKVDNQPAELLNPQQGAYLGDSTGSALNPDNPWKMTPNQLSQLFTS